MSERTRHLVELTEVDLRIILSELICQRKNDSIPIAKTAPMDDLIPRLEVAKLFGISLVTLAKWARLKILPKPIKKGGRVFYLRSQINQCILPNKD